MVDPEVYMAFELKQEVYDRIKDRCIDILKNRSVSRADEMINELMDLEGVIIHCPYHHFIVPATLLTMAAMEKYYKEDKLREWLDLAEARAKQHGELRFIGWGRHFHVRIYKRFAAFS